MFDRIREQVRAFFIEPIRRDTIEQEKRDLLARGPINPTVLRQLERIDKRLAAWKFDDAYCAEQRRTVRVDERLTRDRSVTFRYAANKEGGRQVEYFSPQAKYLNPSLGKNQPYLIDRGDRIEFRAYDKESLRQGVMLSKERYGKAGMEINGDARDPEIRKLIAECVRQGCKMSGSFEIRVAVHEIRRETLREMRQEARDAKLDRQHYAAEGKRSLPLAPTGEARILKLTAPSVSPRERTVLTTDKAERELVLRDLARAGLRPHKPDFDLKIAWRSAVNDVASELSPALSQRIAKEREAINAPRISQTREVKQEQGVVR